ncbi:fructose-6-phosphate aldolase [candidate division KSB1 bacterium]
MKIFLDSADPAEIKQAREIWPVDGVTTNPTLMARRGGDSTAVLKEIADLVSGPVAAEVVATDRQGIIDEGRTLAGLAGNIVVKIPINRHGIEAAGKLAAEGIDTMLTLVFTTAQAIMCARAGATYICPFVGRLDDIGQVGTELVDEIMTVFDQYEIPTRVVVASIRNPQHVIDSAIAGAFAATLPLKVVDQMLHHPLTDKGIELFLRDWEKVKKQE